MDTDISHLLVLSKWQILDLPMLHCHLTSYVTDICFNCFALPTFGLSGSAIFSLLIPSVFFPILAEFGRHGNGRDRRRVPITEGHSAITLSSTNRRGASPSREKMYHARDLPHGLLPRHNRSRGCHGRVNLRQHKEGPGREVESE